jgi:flagellin-like protein
MKMRKIHPKKGVSPVVATVLLIGIVIILAIIIFLWARGFIAERAQKFGRAVELSCNDVNFNAGVFRDDAECGDGGVGYSLDVVNEGNVPLYGFEVKSLTEQGTVRIFSEILGSTVTIGDSATICLDEDATGEDNLLIVPIILGQSDSGKVAFTCPDQLGFSVPVVG